MKCLIKWKQNTKNKILIIFPFWDNKKQQHSKCLYTNMADLQKHQYLAYFLHTNHTFTPTARTTYKAPFLPPRHISLQFFFCSTTPTTELCTAFKHETINSIISQPNCFYKSKKNERKCGTKKGVVFIY